jgi:hypothetical protein
MTTQHDRARPTVVSLGGVRAEAEQLLPEVPDGG